MDADRSKAGKLPPRQTVQQEVEVILARQLASYLAVPIFLVDPEGALLFCNEPAEEILGLRFDETGRMPLEEWSQIFRPTTEDGRPLNPDDLPLVISLGQKRPAYSRFRIQGLDEVSRLIEVASIPLTGQAGRYLGAVAIFWEAG